MTSQTTDMHWVSAIITHHHREKSTVFLGIKLNVRTRFHFMFENYVEQKIRLEIMNSQYFEGN